MGNMINSPPSLSNKSTPISISEPTNVCTVLQNHFEPEQIESNKVSENVNYHIQPLQSESSHDYICHPLPTNTTKIWGTKYHVVEYKTREDYINVKSNIKDREYTSIGEVGEEKSDESEAKEEQIYAPEAFSLRALPELVLDNVLSYLDVHSLLRLRLVSTWGKSLVERLPHVLRLKVQIDSFQILKTISSPDTHVLTLWSSFHFHDRIRELAGPTTVSNTPEWDHIFSKWLTKYGPHIQHFTSESLLTFSEVDRLLSLKSLKTCYIKGYVYSIEHIMNTKRPLGKYDNVILMNQETLLNNLSRLCIEGCTTLNHILSRAPNLNFLCITSAIGANSKVQPGGWRDLHYTRALWEALCAYVKGRYHPLNSRRVRSKLTIDFGKCETDRLTFKEEDGQLEILCALCYPVGLIDFVNVRSKWLPKKLDDGNVFLPGQTMAVKTFSKSYNCIKSVYIVSTLHNRYVPPSVGQFIAALHLFPFYPQATFQLPESTITELSVIDVHNSVSKVELSQVLRPRPDLIRFSLQYEQSPLFDEMIDFSLFPNLKFLQIGKFPSNGKTLFWGLCKHLKQLESLQIREISETILLVKSAGESFPAINKLKELRQLSLKRSAVSKKTVTALKGMHLERLSLPYSGSRISVETLHDLINGPLSDSLKSLEICIKEKLTAEQIDELKFVIKEKCRRLGTLNLYCSNK